MEYLGRLITIQLHTLHLPDCQLGDWRVACLMRSIDKGNLQSLDISSNSVTAELNLQLADLLTQNKELVSLNLSDNQLYGSDFEKLVDQIIAHSSLKRLDLSSNNLGNEGFSVLFKPFIANKGSLQ